MAAAPTLESTDLVLAGLRSELAGLNSELALAVRGMSREEALDLAGRVEEVAREIGALQVTLAHAVEVAPPAPTGSGALVDHGGDLGPAAGSATAAGAPGDEASADCGQPGPGAARGERRAPFARARDLLRTHLRISGAEAGRRLRLGAKLRERVTESGAILPARHPCLAAAARDLDPQAAAEVVRVLERVEALPDATPGDVAALEADLTEYARTFDVDQLRKIGQHAVAVLDPDGAEPEESLARSRQGVHIGRLYQGLATVRMVVDAVQLEILQTVLDAGTNPRTTVSPAASPPAWIDPSQPADPRAAAQESTDPQAGAQEPLPAALSGTPEVPADPRTRPQRQLDALIAAIGAGLRVGALPHTGGAPTQLIVTMGAADLLSAPGAGGVAHLPHVGPVPIDTVRHLTCDAALTTVLLGKHRRVLSVGKRRTAPPWMRRALIARDGTDCAFPGCQIPASWAEAHHIVPWSHGGETSVDNSVLLCPYHHRQCDRGNWLILQTRPGATPTFKPAPYR